jgi:hypothetical protein
MDLNSFNRLDSLHENTVLQICFSPQNAELRLLMDEPVDGGTERKTLIFHGVQFVSIGGSSTDGSTGFIPGDEVLTMEVEDNEPLQGGVEGKLYKVLLLLNPNRRLIRPHFSGLNEIEMLVARIELAD